MWPNPQETADLVTLTQEILNGKLFCAVELFKRWSANFGKLITELFNLSMTLGGFPDACKIQKAKPLL